MPELEKKEQSLKEKKKTKWVYLIIIIFLLVFLVYASTTNLFVKWYIPGFEPTITLIHPSNHETINNNTTYFNWSSNDADGGSLTHVLYIDLLNTFISPYARTYSLGALCNYTPPVFMDGDWYWRVEVSDGSNLNVSDTWHVIFLNDTGNNFPGLSNGTVNPSSGDNTTSFVYTVTFNDTDNDTADYVRVYIDGVMYNMTETNASDTNTSDGKNYSYTTTLGLGFHNYSYACSDGSAINVTGVTENIPYVSPAIVPPGGGPGGGGGSGTGIKMNKITIQPRNLETYPGETFEGNLIITDESYGAIYEVYWYLVLLDSNDNEIAYNNGAIAIDTTVYAPYVVLTTSDIPIGNYRLLAKTYDMPREKITAMEIGMDTIHVKIVSEPLGSDLIEDVKSSPILQIFLIAIALIMAILAVFWKRGIYLIFSIGIILLLLLVFDIVDIQVFSVLGILLIMLGCVFFTRLREKIPIHMHNLKVLIGALLIFAGFVLYFWQFV